jgi:hypothetical protein
MSDGRSAGVANADLDRPDIAAAHPGAPMGTGFRLRLSRPVSRPVCVFAGNTDEDRVNLGCLSVPPNADDGSPIGTVDDLHADVGRITIRGWVVDSDPEAAPDTSDPDLVRGVNAAEVYVDGHWFTRLNADKSRPDVAALVPGAEPDDGFEVVLPARAGPHQICVYGINKGSTGRNVTLGCRDLDVPANSGTEPPVGSLDREYVAPSGDTANETLGASGWSMTPSGGPVRVRILALGGFYANPDQLTDRTGPTGVARADVPTTYPAAPPDTGYEITAGEGHLFHFRLACAIAQSLDTRAETALGCITNSGTVGDRF